MTSHDAPIPAKPQKRLGDDNDPLPGIPLAVDARMLDAGTAAGTGVARYAETLVRALRHAGAAVRLIEDGGPALRRGRLALWAAAARPGRRSARWRGHRLLVRDMFREAHVHFGIHRRLLEIACDGPPGVVHWTYPVPMRIAGWRNIYAVHDAIPLTHPELTPIARRRHRAVLRQIASTADRIVTVSEDARTQIVAALGCPPEGVVARWQPVDVAGAGAVPAGLVPGRFLLFCGTIEPRKNLARLIAAYRASGATLPLVLAGPDGWRAAEIAALAAVTPGVIRLTYQRRAALLGLIAGARALLFPTLAEGFGLPVAEAMALGTPVMTSDRGALAEVAGGACLAVDPSDVAAMAAGIARLAADDALCARLRDAGLVRARAFEPGPYADWLLALYAGTHHDG